MGTGINAPAVTYAVNGKQYVAVLVGSRQALNVWQHAPELNLLYIPSIEGCNTVETVEQKDFVDQGGPIKPRERFAGGAGKPTERLYGSLKALDPATGETKARLKLEYPNYSGALATAGNLVFIGHYDGSFTAHDAKSLQEL